MDNSINIGWWLLFGLLMAVLVGVDLRTLHRKARDPSVAESLTAVAVWCGLAVAFGIFVGLWRGSTAGWQFASGYLLEWSMSVDNVFVFAVIFRYFQVPKQHQYRVLFWGILGAVVMRLGFILGGAALIARFEIVLPLLGLFLIYTSYRLVRHSAMDIDPSKSLIFRLAKPWLAEDGTEQGAGGKEQGAGGKEQGAGGTERGAGGGEQGAAGAESNSSAPGSQPYSSLPAPSSQPYSEAFFVRQNGRLRITPLLLVLLIVETTDLVFAVDSIPAIFGITTNPFIVFTSNVFAILGLRALYFLLADVMDMFRYLHYGLAAVLAFVGIKMVAQAWVGHGEGKELMPPWASLVVIAALLGTAVVASVLAKKKESES